MKIYNINNFKIKSRLIKKIFESPKQGYFFKSFSCSDWKKDLRTQVYIDVKFKGDYKDFLIAMFDQKSTKASIQIMSDTKKRSDYNKKKKYTEEDEIDVNLIDIFHDDMHIVIKNYMPGKTEDEPNMFNCLLYYILVNDDINLNLRHKTIQFNKILTLGKNGKEIYEKLKDITRFQKEIGQVDNFSLLIEKYNEAEKKKEIII